MLNLKANILYVFVFIFGGSPIIASNVESRFLRDIIEANFQEPAKCTLFDLSPLNSTDTPISGHEHHHATVQIYPETNLPLIAVKNPSLMQNWRCSMALISSPTDLALVITVLKVSRRLILFSVDGSPGPDNLLKSDYPVIWEVGID
jgi:hypothetical protein